MTIRIVLPAAIGCAAMAMAFPAALPAAQAEDSLVLPSLTYRTGEFANAGIPLANGFADYFEMLNERDGGIGGSKIVIEECETAYELKKGLECYDAGKSHGALAFASFSAEFTNAVLARTNADEIPILSMGFGLPTVSNGETFPWVFSYPATSWNQMSAIVKYIDSDRGIEDRKIGFIYPNNTYGKEPLPLLEKLSELMNFEFVRYPITLGSVQSQTSQWRNVRKDRPDWMILWGWGAMSSAAIEEAARMRYPLDRVIANPWSGTHGNLAGMGKAGAGFLAANFSGLGQDFAATKAILKYVVDNGNSKIASAEEVGKVLYNRGVLSAVVLAEAISIAQAKKGKTDITASDVRYGLENIVLDEARLQELGLEGFTAEIRGSCTDHEGAGALYMQQWDGENWVKISGFISPMYGAVRPLIDLAAEKYVSDKPDWKGQSCL